MTEKKNIKILVVDDEPGMRDFLSFELADAGYEVVTASDGREGLEAMMADPGIPVIISDILMPNMDGLQFLAEIKKRNSDVEVILATGFGQVDHAVKAMKNGAYDFIQKPYTIDEILAVIEKAVEKSRLRRSRDEALEASRAKSEFLSTMSHEIRTPLNAIVGMAELLGETQLTAEQLEYVQILKRGSETLLTLVNDILDLSKIESGCLELESVPFDLRDVAERAMEFAAAAGHKKGLELACQIPEGLPVTVIGDMHRLRQVLINLLSNAIKFTEKGEVVLHVGLADVKAPQPEGICRLLFCVKDTGIGIAAEKIRAVFEPFTQADSSTTRKYGGTGLGLSISKKFIERMGGCIWAESKPGEGSSFYFELPLKTAGVKAPQPAGFPQHSRVLVADDSEISRFSICQLLKSWNIETVEASGGKQAEEEAAKARDAGRPFTLVLVDCRMPGSGGFESAAAIKRNSQGKQAVFMMLTADSRRGDMARCMELGLKGYLMKPVKRADLLAAVQRASGMTMPERNQPEIEVLKSNLKILLAEDSEDSRILIQRFLREAPCRLDFAENGKQAVEMAAAGKYDVILLDINMPLMDGIEAAKQIRESEKQNGHRAVLLALTANVLKESLQQCLAAGCDQVLTKPVRKNALVDAIWKTAGKAAA